MTCIDDYLSGINSLGGDEAGRRAAWEYLRHSTNIYQGHVVACDFMPKLFDRRLRDRLVDVAQTTYGILEKIMRRYLEDPDYRTLYSFDPRLEELILTPRGYDSLLPFARIDLFLNEDDLSIKYCEFNTDGSSGMNENREAEQAIITSASYQAFAKKHTMTSMVPVMFDGWVTEFLRIYGTWTYPKDNPHVALVDYLEDSVIEEFKLYQELFEKRGISCSIFDVRDLHYEQGKLTGQNPYLGLGHAGEPIDAIWRRAVTTDVMAHYDESGALLDAFRDGAVPLIGSFLTTLVHDKQVFTVMQDKRTLEFLTEDEQAFVHNAFPHTDYLDSARMDIADIIANPSRYIIKPTDGYGCRDVFPGPSYSEDEWRAIVEKYQDSRTGWPMLVQEFCTPFKTPAIALRGNEEDYTAAPKMYNNLTGMYLIDGRLAGIFSRLGPEPLILGRCGGLTAPSFWVDCPSPFTGGQDE